MKLLYLQHVEFEDPAMINIWAASRGISMRPCRLYLGDPLPPQDTFDALLIMGGPMGVNDVKEYPWLKAEKKFIEKSVLEGKPVMGICLGSQLLADVLGGKVYKNKQKEIGWFPVMLTDQGKKHPLFSNLPDSFTVFQWHGDTFKLPKEAVHLAESEACSVQAFCIGETVLGLQFHLELAQQHVEQLTIHAADDITDDPWVQSAEAMLMSDIDYQQSHALMQQVCDALFISHPADEI